MRNQRPNRSFPFCICINPKPHQMKFSNRKSAQGFPHKSPQFNDPTRKPIEIWHFLPSIQPSARRLKSSNRNFHRAKMLLPQIAVSDRHRWRRPPRRRRHSYLWANCVLVRFVCVLAIKSVEWNFVITSIRVRVQRPPNTLCETFVVSCCLLQLGFITAFMRFESLPMGKEHSPRAPQNSRGVFGTRQTVHSILFKRLTRDFRQIT